MISDREIKMFMMYCKNDVEGMKDFLDRKSKTEIFQLKAELKARLARKDGWSSFMGFFNVILSVCAVIIAICSLVKDERQIESILVVCVEYFIPFVIVIIVIAVGGYLYVGDRKGEERALDYIESYLQYGFYDASDKGKRKQYIVRILDKEYIIDIER